MVRRIKLSKYFSENTRIVAGMCPKCYDSCNEVRIVSVNGIFLKQLTLRKWGWKPSHSPHNLVEEALKNNPWGLLVATIFLNRTSCFCARPFIHKFLEDFPSPEKVLEVPPRNLEGYFEGLGLNKKRAVQVWRMSFDFLHKPWRRAAELYGIGRYGEDAFRMFCLDDFSVEPKDRFLKIYKAWYLAKGKESIQVSKRKSSSHRVISDNSTEMTLTD